MAQRRMFNKTITNNDNFLEMPCSSQSLYFHLSMNADDDGFVDNWKSIMRMTGNKDDDMKILIAKQYVIPFESGVIVIKHWRLNNYLQKDRYTQTIYKQEIQQLTMDNNNGYILDTSCIHSIDKLSIEENSLDKISEDKNRLEIVNSRSDIEYEKEFEQLWELYPNKKSKKKALGYYINARKKGTTYEEIESGLYNYLDYIKNEKTDVQYIKHGSTWFNQECWNDEYLIRQKTLKDISMAEIDEALRREREQKGDTINNDTVRFY